MENIETKPSVQPGSSETDVQPGGSGAAAGEAVDVAGSGTGASGAAVDEPLYGAEETGAGIPAVQAGVSGAAGAVGGVDASAVPVDEPSGIPAGCVKAGILERFIARFIDILFTLLLAKLPGYVGFFAGLTYIAIADGLPGGGSIGKRIIALKVINTVDGEPADLRASILRNSTMGLLYMLFKIPVVGWIFAAAGLAFELLLIIGSPAGRRLGDEVASTLVVTGVPARQADR